MRSSGEHSVASIASLRELQVLEAVSNRPDVSQRQLAGRLGVALGATNLLIRRLADQGYIHASKIGWRQWSYAITDRGVSHKARLNLRVVERFLHQYRSFRASVRDELKAAGISVGSRMAIVGSGEMAELVYFSAKELGVETARFFDAVGRSGSGDTGGNEHLNPVETMLGQRVGSIESLAPADYDLVVIATTTDASECLAGLVRAGVGEDRIVTLMDRSAMGLTRLPEMD